MKTLEMACKKRNEKRAKAWIFPRSPMIILLSSLLPLPPAHLQRRAFDCAAYLLTVGADHSAVTHDGTTPTHIAAVWGHFEALRLLIKAGETFSYGSLSNISGPSFILRSYIFTSIRYQWHGSLSTQTYTMCH